MSGGTEHSKNTLKITDDEVHQIKRLSNSRWVLGVADATLRGMDETMLSNMIASYLYFKSSGRPDKDFITYVTTKELWGTAAIGLNLIGAIIPAMIFDKEFRMLAIKTGMSKGSEIASKTIEKRIAKTDLDATTDKIKTKIGIDKEK